MAAKPKIACLPNGPYSLVNEETGLGETLRRSSGEPLAVAGKASLCRCGGSKKKPFCDGTHRTNGFSDRIDADPAANPRRTYVGKKITILDNRAICSHAAYCTDELASVFRHKQDPWIDPDGAAADRIIETVRKCPSGALSYAIDGVEAAPPQRAPMVTVCDNGPYAITGGVELMGVKFGDGASTEHYTLCRCGASKNKPFCDGSHWYVDFKDPT
jgi:CDGSH-type Zn-finger protein